MKFKTRKGVTNMKGLLLKDYYCMKHNLISFLCLTIGVIVIGVLFAVSIHHGNMADVVETMVVEEGVTAESVYDLFRLGVWLVLLIPLAYVGNVIDCFKVDQSANFGKQIFSMPVKPIQMVGARYLACLLYAGLSFVGSFFAAICVSFAANQYPLSELLTVTITFGAVLLIYLSIVMVLLYSFGTQYADTIQTVPILAVMIVGAIYTIVKMEHLSGEQEDAFMSNIWGCIKGFLTQYTGILCIIALVILVLSFFASVKIVEKRRANAIC